MPISPGATSACLTVQQTLDDIAGSNITTYRIQNVGALQAIRNPANTAGFEQLDYQDMGGKNRKLIIQYWTNPLTEATTTCNPTICTPDATTAQKFAEFATTKCASVKLTLSDEQFRAFCGTGVKDSEFARQQTVGKVNQLLAQIDTQAVTHMNSYAGNFYGGIAPGKTVKLINTTAAPIYNGEVTISNDLEDAGVTGIPAAVGSGYLRNYTKLANVACCDSNGIDMSKATSSTWIYHNDNRVDTVTGDPNTFFLIAPGAMQLVTRNYWTGPYADIRSDAEAKMTVDITIPGDGVIPVDFSVYKPFCGTDNTGRNVSWVLTWALEYDFFHLPPDLEAVGSPYNSVNGIFKYVAECGTPSCSDVDS